MRNIKFKECNASFAKNQKEYLELQAFVNEGVVVTCYKLSWRERLKILFTGKLWLGQMTFGTPLQPQKPSVNKKDLIDYE